MKRHTDLGQTAAERQKAVFALIHGRHITLAGYRKTKIYGLLSCSSGKKMNIENRVFFKDDADALGNGYRPCGHCMKRQYRVWKNRTVGLIAHK